MNLKLQPKHSTAQNGAAEKKKKKKKNRTPEEQAAHDLRKAERKRKKAAAAAAAAANGTDAPVKSNKRHKSNKHSSNGASASQDVDMAAAPSTNGLLETKDAPDSNGNPPLSAFPLLPEIRTALLKRNVTHLFPIQARTFAAVSNSKDVIGRARTGTGKTLAFALPVTQMLLKESGAGKPKYGRLPRVIVLCPTRELAHQVGKDFESLSCGKLSVLCVYGGAAMGPQQASMRRGLDVVVGTCGRVKDHIERGTLKLSDVKHVILDEADEMLNMGFQEDVETILKAVSENLKEGVQTLLFSATVPKWVNEVAVKYLKKDHEFFDLVGNSKQKAAKTVDHILIPIHWTEKASVLAAVINKYAGPTGSTIVFTETKKEANELAVNEEIKQDCQVLHGDIPQHQREITLKGFRNRNFKVLIATDVAARGLDIENIDLVVQLEPPQSAETYVHRSGRTGRANTTGVCVTFYTRKQAYFVNNIERRAGFKFNRQSAPQEKDIIAACVPATVKRLNEVHVDVLPYFEKAAQDLVSNGDSVEVLSRALAVLSGHTQPPQARSMLSACKGWVTVVFRCKQEMRSLSFVWNGIRRHLFGDDCDDKIRGMRMCKDRHGAVFDIPTEHQSTVTSLSFTDRSPISFEIAEKLPELVPMQVLPPPQQRWRSRGRPGSSFGGGNRRWSGGGRRGGGGRGRGGFRRGSRGRR